MWGFLRIDCNVLQSPSFFVIPCILRLPAYFEKPPADSLQPVLNGFAADWSETREPNIPKEYCFHGTRMLANRETCRGCHTLWELELLGRALNKLSPNHKC